VPHHHTDQVSIVTGAASGIGRAITHRLIDAGAIVVAIDLDADGLESARTSASRPDDVETLAGDVADPALAAEAVARASSRGRLSSLAAAAGIIDRDDFFTANDETWRRLLDINLLGYVTFSRTVAAHMSISGTGGSIVLVSSITGHISSPLVTYSTTKAAVLGFVRSVSPLLAHQGIRINTVSPGVTHTGMNDARLLDPSSRDADLHHIPLGRLGTPNDVASAVLFLLGPDASYITGTDLIVDGGYQHHQG
jgi:NAD(P)-dependent dehydrogenase (short-subunit alcohol dehydrogenase family)